MLMTIPCVTFSCIHVYCVFVSFVLCFKSRFMLKQAFNGNKDTDTEVVNMFTQPIQAKCIKINPEAWNNHISLRMDLIGCFRVATQQLSVLVTQPTTTPTTTTKQTTTLQTTSIPTTTTPTTSQGPLCHGSLINNSTIGSLVNLTASSQFHNPASGTDPTRALLDTKTEHINAYTLLGGWSPTKDDGKQYIQVYKYLFSTNM